MADEFREFISHLTDNARTSLHHANLIAHGSGSSYIGTEHLLLGILAQGSSVGAKILADSGITLDRAQNALNLAPIMVVVNGNESKGLSETAKLTLKMSWEVANEFHHELMGTEHILYSILNQKNARASVLLRDMNANFSVLIANIESILGNQNEKNDGEHIASSSTENRNHKSKGALGLFGFDLTDAAKHNKLDPVIGRSVQIERAITILSRRTKNNPVLIGEPGVGKTAIAEGLAQKIVDGDVPEHLLSKKIIRLDLTGMIAGTKYRGEFEDRFKKIISEVEKQPDIILFIDELHLLVGAGAAEGSIDAANMLKPALARGEIRMLGATTIDEYRKHIEKDSALDRRLQTIIVPEPSIKNTISILKGLRDSYEKHHGINLSDEVIENAVYAADRYISERFMPDKAIDVIDEASALLRVKRGEKPSKLRELQKESKNLSDKIEEAVSSEDYERAALYKTRASQVSLLIEDIREKSENKTKINLSLDDVANAVSQIANIPVNRIQKSEAKLLRNLEKHLSKFIIGQEEAISNVSKAIRRGRSGVASSRRPIGSFVFMGPTGVGKTELARVIAREVFGSESSLIKIDMSEFSERHNTSRLIGAPAGYVGYEDGGKLTDKIRRQPYSVVLFDEIEKAHPEVFNLLLQLLEDGTLTDAKGRVVNFSNAVIILTSNLGSESMKKESSLGFHASSKTDEQKLENLHENNAKTAEAALAKIMKPELINRFDSVITFRALTHKQIGKIFDNNINELQERLISKGLHLVIKPAAKKLIISRGYDEKFGARPLRRAIQNELEHKIAEGILDGNYQKGSVLTINAKSKEITVDVESE